MSVALSCVHSKYFHMEEIIHGSIIPRGFKSHAYVAISIIYMHVKFQSVQIRFQVFDRMPNISAMSWNSMATGYAQNGHANEALATFYQI